MTQKSIPLIFEILLCTYNLQLIDPLLILNFPCILLLFVIWYTPLTPHLSLAPTEMVLGMLMLSLVFCFQIFLWFSNLFCTCTPWLIDPWFFLNYPSFLRLIFNWLELLTPDTWLTSTDPLLGLLLSSLVFCSQKFLWFSKKNLHLHSQIDRPPIDPQLPWSSAVYCWFIRIADPISINTNNPVPRSSRSSAVDFW